jgi:hypothetical protein
LRKKEFFNTHVGVEKVGADEVSSPVSDLDESLVC